MEIEDLKQEITSLKEELVKIRELGEGTNSYLKQKEIKKPVAIETLDMENIDLNKLNEMFSKGEVIFKKDKKPIITRPTLLELDIKYGELGDEPSDQDIIDFAEGDLQEFKNYYGKEEEYITSVRECIDRLHHYR